jgi:hypothetical protein
MNDAVTAAKAKVIQGLNSVTKPVQPFLFGRSTQDLLETLTATEERADDNTIIEPNELAGLAPKPESTAGTASKATPLPPFAISSLQGSDSQEMDASLLMSSTYFPPLLQSELPSLVEHLFDPEHMLWLRHNAALKFVSWRETQVAAITSSLNGNSLDLAIDPIHHQRMQAYGARSLVRRHTESGRNTSNTLPAIGFSGLDLLNHMNDADRALWLLQRVSDEVARGNIGVLASQGPLGSLAPLAATQQPEERRRGQQGRRRVERGEVAAWARRGRGGRVRVVEVDPADPLGLVRLWEGWRAVVACVGVGALGGAIYAVVTTRGWYGGWGTTGARF